MKLAGLTKKPRLPRPAMVVAVIALVAALAGTATAANGLINGKKIKRGTITSKQIKNKTIALADMNPKTVKKLKGAVGPRGPQGAPGTPGPQGPAGPAGVIDPISVSSGSVNVDAGDTVVLSSFNAPKAGSYVVQSKTNLVSVTESGRVECRLMAGATTFDFTNWNASEANDRTSVNLMGVVDLAANQTVKFECDFEDSNGGVYQGKLIALPVG